ncbi:hypothetical protein ACYJ1Y_12500 [Natrialbaceae archaeon A-gly3]
MSDFRLAVKQSVFRETSLSAETYGEDPELVFDSEAKARTWIDERNDQLSGHGALTLHTAHPNDSSDVDAYLVYKSQGVWTVD